MVSLAVAYALGHCVVLNVCRIRANPEMGRGGGVSAATVATRLVTWGLWRGYDYEPWSNGHSFSFSFSLSLLSPRRGPLRGMARSIGCPPTRRRLVLQVPCSLSLWSWRGSSGIEVGVIGIGWGMGDGGWEMGDGTG